MASTFSGHLRLRATARADGRTTLAEQSFRAPFHLSKPYWDADARTLLVQVVNPTAGILAGDQLESEIAVDSDATLLVTTPSASRLFTMKGGTAECRQSFKVAASGWLEVAPEPLVPHRNSEYRQSTHIEIGEGGGLYWVDQLTCGRTGHGEAWLWGRLCLELTVTIGGQLVLRERFDHRAGELRRLAEFCGSGSTACFANAVLVAGNHTLPSATLAAIRQLHGDGGWVGISALRHSGWSIKVVAPNSIAMRETLARIRRALAANFPRLTCDARKL